MAEETLSMEQYAEWPSELSEDLKKMVSSGHLLIVHPSRNSAGASPKDYYAIFSEPIDETEVLSLFDDETTATAVRRCLRAYMRGETGCPYTGIDEGMVFGHVSDAFKSQFHRIFLAMANAYGHCGSRYFSFKFVVHAMLEQGVLPDNVFTRGLVSKHILAPIVFLMQCIMLGGVVESVMNSSGNSIMGPILGVLLFVAYQYTAGWMNFLGQSRAFALFPICTKPYHRFLLYLNCLSNGVINYLVLILLPFYIASLPTLTDIMLNAVAVLIVVELDEILTYSEKPVYVTGGVKWRGLYNFYEALLGGVQLAIRTVSVPSDKVLRYREAQDRLDGDDDVESQYDDINVCSV